MNFLLPLLVLLVAFPALGQEARRLTPIEPGIVEHLAALARDNLSKARLSEGSPIAPETAEEKSRPLVPMDMLQRTVDRGAITAQAEWCGLDWKNRSFIPFMQQERNRGTWSDKQLAYIGLLHGVTQGSYENAMRSVGECNASQRAQAEQALTR